MPTVSNITVVDKSGNIVFQADERGARDGTSRFGTLTLTDRIFATPLAAYMWRCTEGVWQVQYVAADCSVTGGASTTCDVLVCATAVAPGSGTSQLTAVMDIEATAPFAVNGVLIASPTQIFPGMLVARVFGGTVASVEGILTVQVKRIS